MRVRYARVSTTDQSPELQLDALRRAGCERIHSEKASGAKADRPELTRVLDDVLRRGDVLVVWKLDRLARSLKKLITTAEDLEGRGIGLVSLTESIDPGFPRWIGLRLTLSRCLLSKFKGLRSQKRLVLLSPAAPAVIGLYLLA